MRKKIRAGIDQNILWTSFMQIFGNQIFFLQNLNEDFF